MKHVIWLLLFVACNIESGSGQHATPLDTTPTASAPQSVQVGDIEYRYDNLGRVVGKGDLELTYGPDGHLATARRGQDVWSYAYDEKGNRILKKKNGRPVAAFLDGTYIIEDKVYTPIYVQGRLIGVLEGKQFHLLGVDPRGTVITDRDGTPRPASPYGVRTTRPDVSEALDYIAKGYDPVLGTVRMGVRDYDPYLGQFWTPDPLYFEQPERCIDSPVECNLYSYARNNPVSYTDPSGLGVDLFQRAESESYCAHNPVQCQAASGPTMGEIARRGLDLGGQMAVNIGYGAAMVLFCGYECSQAGENAGASKGPLEDLRDGLFTAFAVTNPFRGVHSSPYGTTDDAVAGVLGSQEALRPIARSLGAAGDDLLLKKAVNSNLSHAIERGVERGVFRTADEAGAALRGLTEQITNQRTFPSGTLVDTARPGRFLVPVGHNGIAVYQLAPNGTAKLKTVLIAR